MTKPSPFARALRRHAAAHDVDCDIIADVEQPWASATFVGRVHRLTIAPDDDARAVRWLAALPEADLPLPRAFVADLTVHAPTAITALVIEE